MDPEVIAAFAAFGCLVIIPIVAMMLNHQRKMAALLHHSQPNSNEVNELKFEVQRLTQLVHEQAIQNDDLRQRLNSVSKDQSISS